MGEDVMVRLLAVAALLIAVSGAPFAACAQGARPPAPDSLDEGPPQGSNVPPQGGPGGGSPGPGGGSPGPGGGNAPLPQPSPSNYWGAIGFTADGSWQAVWRIQSKPEAEAQAAIGCAKFGRGECKVVSFSGDSCVGLATFIGVVGRTRWRLSFTEGAKTSAEAQRAALGTCNEDKRTRGRCQLRTVVCADGR
jgi:hypothetical protein